MKISPHERGDAMNADEFQSALRKLGACREGRESVQGQSLAEFWAASQRGDYMLWLAGRVSGEPGSDARRKLTLAACECARLALPLVKPGEDRPRIAIETAEQWARGEGVTLDDVRKRASEAWKSDAYVAYAAYAAAYVAYAAYAAAYAAYAAAYAAYAADDAYDAYDAYDAAARAKILSQCADIVRKHYPTPPEVPS